MASNTCGWCGKASHMKPLDALSWESRVSGPTTQVTYRCDNCSHFSIALTRGKSNHATDLGINDAFLTVSSDTKWVPKKGDVVEYADVPEIIASAASEAHECFSIGARRAAILMARSVIEASAKAHNISSGTLYTKIDAMAEQRIIRPLIAEAAHGIRVFGNDMAHGDFEVEITDDDVRETLGLMAVVLSEVFQVDARTKSLRARFEARKGGTQEDNPES